MKTTIKTIASLVMAITMILGMTLTASAADSSITYEGGAEKYVFLPGSEYTDSDLFDNFKDVMPGDVLSEEITVKNDYKGSDYVKIYMRAVAHDENGNPLTYSEIYENIDGKDQANVGGQRDETVATMHDFLSQLSMKIWNGDELIYEASPDELDGLQNNVLLGEFEPGESTELIVELSVPIELGNEYANRVGEVDWVFVAEELNEPETPDTGDHSNVMIWIGLMAIALVCFTIVLMRRKRQ